MYNLIFHTNVLQALDKKNMTKVDLARLSGVSPSFLTSLTKGTANPSLDTMETIAAALEIPLPDLLEVTDLDEASFKQLEKEANLHTSIPSGYERVSVALPKRKAFIVKEWARQELKKTTNN